MQVLTVPRAPSRVSRYKLALGHVDRRETFGMLRPNWRSATPNIGPWDSREVARAGTRVRSIGCLRPTMPKSWPAGDTGSLGTAKRCGPGFACPRPRILLECLAMDLRSFDTASETMVPVEVDPRVELPGWASLRSGWHRGAASGAGPWARHSLPRNGP